MSLPDDDEGLAAEYALGSLDAAERAAVAARRLRSRSSTPQSPPGRRGCRR